MPRTKQMIPVEVQEQMIRDNRRMPYQQVAKIYGYGRNKTYEVVKNTCEKKVGRKTMFDSRQVAELEEDYLNGLSVKKLAKKYGCCQALIYKVLNNQGVEVSKGKALILKIQDDIRSGEKQSAIAKKYGCSRQYVNEIKKKMGGNEDAKV